MDLTKYYEILEVSPHYTIDEVKSQVRKLLRQFHPDVNLSNKDFYEEKTKEILSAYHILLKEKSEDNREEEFHTPPEEKAKTKHMVVFKITNVKYGLLVENVKEIFRAKDVRIRPVPPSDEKILGLILWKDVVVPLYKLNNGFNGQDISFSSEQIIIATNNSKIAGFLVDKVEEVLPISASFLLGDSLSPHKYLLGTYRVNGEMVCILNINHLI